MRQQQQQQQRRRRRRRRRSPPRTRPRPPGGRNLLLLWGLLLALATATAKAAIREYELNVTHGFRALDGVERLVILVNGQTPGPMIRASKGDRLRVRVNNQLADEEGLSLHFHGMWNRAAPFADGTTLSQCPIPSGESFVYDFGVGDQVGSYFYHGHLETLQQADGLYGPLVVEDPEPPVAYDEERIIMLSDFWHRDGRTLAAGLVQQPFRWVGDPQSILNNGKGNYSCPAAATATATATATAGCPSPPLSPAQALEQVLVKPGKTYLLRVIGATSLSFLDFAVEGHALTVVEADGNYVKPYETTHLPVNSGERYGVLLRTRAQRPQQQPSFWIATETRFRTLAKGFAVLQYTDDAAAAAATELILPPTPAADFVHPGTWAPEILDLQKQYMTMLAANDPPEAWEVLRDRVYRLQAQAMIEWTRGLRAVMSAQASSSGSGMVIPQGNATRAMRLVQHQCRASRDGAEVYTPYDPATETYVTRNNGNGYLRWCMNNQTTRGAVTPALLDLLAAGRRELPAGGGDPMIVPLRPGENVDILLMNGRALNNVSEQHPFHLHGHAFWVLGQGVGPFNASALNLVDAPSRDMVTLFPFGWALLRFQATNPGVWPFHCHVQSHAIMGMNVVFIEDAPALAGSLPPEGFGLCGRLSSFSAKDPAMAALFLRGSSNGGPRSTVVPLVLFLALSLLVNLVLLARTPRVRGWYDAAARRVLNLRSPRTPGHQEEEGGERRQRVQPLPTESPTKAGAAAGRGAKEEEGGIEFMRSPVGS